MSSQSVAAPGKVFVEPANDCRPRHCQPTVDQCDCHDNNKHCAEHFRPSLVAFGILLDDDDPPLVSHGIALLLSVSIIAIACSLFISFPLQFFQARHMLPGRVAPRRVAPGTSHLIGLLAVCIAVLVVLYPR
jgi:hypothetical protein